MVAKRKATAAAVTSAADAPDAKRRKLPVQPIQEETPESTTEIGLGFLAQIKSGCDKRHRPIATRFLTLPDKKKLPQYYQVIALPIALDTIEDKLNRRQYPTLSTLESDLKRMVSNAKLFNEKGSDVYSDAERIRKMVSNYMIRVNPAYKDGSGYTPMPTPLPGEKQNGTSASTNSPDDGEDDADADGETDVEETVPVKPRKSVTLHGPSAEKELNRRRASSTPAVQEAEDAGEDFEGNTFQQAQEKIMSEMIQLKNKDDQLISGPFQNLPPRDLRDYYRIIKHPQCLKGAQKMVRGVKGRDKPTGVSFFKSWQAFEDEISYIWKNARQYNEDGSEIFELANEFEAYFNRRLTEAKKVVSEPPQPKLRIKMSAKSPEPKIKLRFGQKSAHSEDAVIKVDDSALKRQQELVTAGANGQSITGVNGTPSLPPSRNPFSGTKSSSASIPIPTTNTTSQSSGGGSATSPPIIINGVKDEIHVAKAPTPVPAAVKVRRGSDASKEATQSPRLAAVSMPPPASLPASLPTGSPHLQPAASSNHLTHSHTLTNPLDSRWRQPGKDASDALISNVTIATHPGLKLDHHFHLDIPPSPTASQQSVVVNLPATHYCLQIIPTISAKHFQRQHKLFVTVGNQRLNPSPMRAEETDPRRPLYDTRVLPGVNRIEVEMIAGPPRGAPKVGPGQDIELEKTTVFVNILRS
ncbi:MAG: hypothetical protein Q9187_002428 [Circinaria calcarea]